jgi:23S rRNA pseudouridine2457 synthase
MYLCRMGHRHFLLHKPYGYLSQFVYRLKRDKKVLGALYPFPEGTMAIGRLDEDSEGLLLLTTDGVESERIRGRKVEKEYYAQVDGLISDQAVNLLCEGVEIGVKGTRYKVKAVKASAISEPDFGPRGKNVRSDRHGPTSWISITLREGKFRQVRKMTAAAGFPTLRLVRVRIGNLVLDNLPSGAVIEVETLNV